MGRGLIDESTKQHVRTVTRLVARQGMPAEQVHALVDEAFAEKEHDEKIAKLMLLPAPELADKGINDMRGKHEN